MAGRAWQRPVPLTDPRLLRPDLVILVKSCRICGKDHIHQLGGKLPVTPRTPNTWWTRTKAYHGAASDCLTLSGLPGCPMPEGRLFLADPGSLLELRMAEDPEDAFAWREDMPGVRAP